jgi:hypothetical protein
VVSYVRLLCLLYCRVTRQFFCLPMHYLCHPRMPVGFRLCDWPRIGFCV